MTERPYWRLCSEISASALPFPIVEPCRLEALDLEAILFAYVIVLVGEWLHEVHDVLLIQFITLFWQVLVLVVRLLANHVLRVYGLHDFLLRELLWLEILTKGCLLILHVKFFRLVETSSGDQSDKVGILA